MKSKRAWILVATMHIMWVPLVYTAYVNWPAYDFFFQVTNTYLGFWLGILTFGMGVDASVETGEEV